MYIIDYKICIKIKIFKYNTVDESSTIIFGWFVFLECNLLQLYCTIINNNNVAINH